MMKSLFSSFISENFSVPQRESNLCLLITGTVVLPLDYRVSVVKQSSGKTTVPAMGDTGLIHVGELRNFLR